jgi:hypothetical protein
MSMAGITFGMPDDRPVSGMFSSHNDICTMAILDRVTLDTCYQDHCIILNMVFISCAPSRLCYPACDDEHAISTVTGPFPSIFFAIYIIFILFIDIMT